MADLVQIEKQRLKDNRVPLGASPSFQLELEPNQQIVRFNVYGSDWIRRQTVDWTAEVWVATRLD